MNHNSIHITNKLAIIISFLLFLLFLKIDEFFSLLSIAFLSIFLILSYFYFKIEFLKKFGRKLQVEIKNFEIHDTGIPKMGYFRKLRYKAFLEWKDEYTGKIHTFQSYWYGVPWWEKNGEIIVGLPNQVLTSNDRKFKINVFVHKKNFKYYFVDFPDKLIRESIYRSIFKENNPYIS